MNKKIIYGLLCLSLGLNVYFIQKKYVPRFAVMYRQAKSFVTGGEMTGPRELTSEQTLIFYQMMKDTHEILGAHEIPYAAIGGTLLGAVRHKGIIPWDDDLDIAVPLAYELRLQDIFPEFQKLGYHVSDNDFCYKIYLSDPEKWIGDTVYPPCLDIFVERDRGDGELIHSKWKARKAFPQDVLPKGSFESRKLLSFGDLTIYAPSDPETVLDREYPKGWKDVAYLMPHEHLMGEKQDTTKFTMKKYEPAKPFGPLQDRYKK